MNIFKKLYYKLIPTYRRLELKLCSYGEADKLIKENDGKHETHQWVIAKEEDTHSVNPLMPTVWLERRERIYG